MATKLTRIELDTILQCKPGANTMPNTITTPQWVMRASVGDRVCVNGVEVDLEIIDHVTFMPLDITLSTTVEGDE